ncbi:unnamed protein product [Ectocarpus sp. 12 AP-2014]
MYLADTCPRQPRTQPCDDIALFSVAAAYEQENAYKTRDGRFSLFVFCTKSSFFLWFGALPTSLSLG